MRNWQRASRDHVRKLGLTTLRDQGARARPAIGVFDLLQVRDSQFVEPARDNGDRVSRAMTHLVRLCSGRPELF